MTGTQHSSSTRIARLAEELARSGVDAYFATSTVSLAYLHGLHESGGERFLTLIVAKDGRTRMIGPALTASQALRAGIADVRAWRDGEDPMLHVRAVADEWGLRSGVLAVDDDMAAVHLLALQTTLPAALFQPGQPLISALARIKDARELDCLRRAGRIADEAFPRALTVLKPGITEVELADALSTEMRKLGGKPTFAIVATGANGAEPHHHSDDTVIREGDVVVMDFGCDVDGYQSDITRMACVGSASEEAKAVYRTVLAAHRAARTGIRAGIPAQEIDRAARRVIEEAGYGEFFVHRLGHGLGMRIHEEPYIVEGNDTPLEAGNVFSVEPGIYLPGCFGVRIENIVVATDDGHESLNAEPAEDLLEIR